MKESGFSAIFLIIGILLLLLIVIGANYATSQIKNTNNLNNYSSSLNISPSIPQNEPLPIKNLTLMDYNQLKSSWVMLDIKDWRSYRDNDLDYTIKIPRDWFLVPGSRKQLNGVWQGSSTYISNKEDREYGKGLEERALSLDLKDRCAISINAVDLKGTTLEFTYRKWRGGGDDKVIKTIFQDSDAYYNLQKPKQTEFTKEKIQGEEFWFKGALKDHVYNLQMQSSISVIDLCQKTFHTIISTYQ